MLKRLMVVTLAAVAIGACAPAPAPAPAAPPDTAADEAKLKADLTKWMTDFNAGNTDAVAAQYADDAVLMPPNVPAATGGAAIRKALATEYTNAKAAGLALGVSGTPSVGVSGDIAWMQGTYVATDAKGATLDTGKFLSVHRKTNGTWLYIRDAWNSDNPPPPPPPPAKK